eukprot:CAMPEP_0184519188 /NCGR_PEP_ID=MMETSP0198_2-20121128/6491_1 /TAXON_ID=1112570 /ORGANISM="Thraustochytrium sp., Strain LLF1b" /LENGTH=70 /DNA_ID=CAMNT_0026909683 /DNA_START=70 /DNA_END=282 /DNA_ORIENTATION=-
MSGEMLRGTMAATNFSQILGEVALEAHARLLETVTTNDNGQGIGMTVSIGLTCLVLVSGPIFFCLCCSAG